MCSSYIHASVRNSSTFHVGGHEMRSEWECANTFTKGVSCVCVCVRVCMVVVVVFVKKKLVISWCYRCAFDYYASTLLSRQFWIFLMFFIVRLIIFKSNMGLSCIYNPCNTTPQSRSNQVTYRSNFFFSNLRFFWFFRVPTRWHHRKNRFCFRNYWKATQSTRFSDIRVPYFLRRISETDESGSKTQAWSEGLVAWVESSCATLAQDEWLLERLWQGSIFNITLISLTVQAQAFQDVQHENSPERSWFQTCNYLRFWGGLHVAL